MMASFSNPPDQKKKTNIKQKQKKKHKKTCTSQLNTEIQSSTLLKHQLCQM